jgi:hypothetical protein
LYKRVCKNQQAIKNRRPKRVAVLTQWQWLDIIYTPKIKMGANASMMYSTKIFCSSDVFQKKGHIVRSSFLVKFHDNCLFESETSFYIFMDDGVRKTVPFEDVIKSS